MLLSAANLKIHLRVLHDHEDSLIESYSKAAQEFAEEYTNLTLQEREFEIEVAKVTGCWLFPKQPVISVTKVEAKKDGVYEIVDKYVIFQKIGLSYLSFGKEMSDLKITFKAGFKSGAVPESILQWIRCAVSEMYEYRELDESKFHDSFALHLLKRHRVTSR